MITLNYPAASMRATHRGNVLEFAFAGTLTRAVMEAALMEWQCLAGGHRESAYLFRMDDARWASGEGEDFSSLVTGHGPWVTRPSAIVVCAGNLMWFRRLALAQAAVGVVVGVFTCADEASAWVRRRVPALAPRPVPRQIQSLAKSARKRAGAALHPV